MTSGHVFIATSLDGFIARPDGRLDWLEHPGAEAEDHGYGAFVASVDGILMGRATFEVVLGFDPWPYDKPVIVLGARARVEDVPPPCATGWAWRAPCPRRAPRPPAGDGGASGSMAGRRSDPAWPRG